MPFGFRRFSPESQAFLARIAGNTSPMPFGFRRFSPAGMSAEDAIKKYGVTNAFRLPPLFSLMSFSKTSRTGSNVTNAFRLPPLFSRQLQPVKHRRAFASPMPFGFRRFSPPSLLSALAELELLVTNAFRLPPLFSPKNEH